MKYSIVLPSLATAIKCQPAKPSSPKLLTTQHNFSKPSYTVIFQVAHNSTQLPKDYQSFPSLITTSCINHSFYHHPYHDIIVEEGFVAARGSNPSGSDMQIFNTFSLLCKDGFTSLCLPTPSQTFIITPLKVTQIPQTSKSRCFEDPLI